MSKKLIVGTPQPLDPKRAYVFTNELGETDRETYFRLTDMLCDHFQIEVMFLGEEICIFNLGQTPSTWQIPEPVIPPATKFQYIGHKGALGILGKIYTVHFLCKTEQGEAPARLIFDTRKKNDIKVTLVIDPTFAPI